MGALALSVGAILMGLTIAVAMRSARRYRPLHARTHAELNGRRIWPVAVQNLTARLGKSVRRALRLPSDASADLRVGRSLLVVALAMAVSMLAALIVGTTLFILSVSKRRRHARNQEGALQDRLAEIVDLYAVAIHSGHNVTTATEQVASWLKGDVGIAFQWCCDQVQQGRQQSEVLEDLPARTGEALRPLVAALIAHDRHGAPISVQLAQLAADTRVERRRRAEAAARRLPVTLLFPLVVCVLPAFLLLTVVPVVAEAFSSLGLSASS